MMTNFRSPGLALVLALASIAQVAQAQDSVDLDVLSRIRDEGFRRSQVMETLGYLSDEIGP